MTKWRIDLAYDGGDFHGYARQNGLPTIQGELEDALAKVLGVEINTAVAGRTDAGVHARGQVVSFAHAAVEPDLLRRSLNGIIGPKISIAKIAEASDDFDARYSAIWRRYRYLIDIGLAPDPLRRHEAWWHGRALDVEAMREVAGAFVGRHDFASFCRSGEGKSTVRRLESAEWTTDGKSLEFWVQANAFCHQMVRSLVGFCFDVGRGYSKAESVEKVIAARDRSEVRYVAPSHGLTLWEVGYDT